MRTSPSHAGARPPSFFRWLIFLRRGGGYDPRLRHMQVANQYLQNIYELIEINYKVFPLFVKENQERLSGRSFKRSLFSPRFQFLLVGSNDILGQMIGDNFVAVEFHRKDAATTGNGA